MGSRYSARKSISSKAEEAVDKTNKDQATFSKKESLTKSIRADEPDDKQIITSASDIISKATDDLHQDEQNETEIREEIIPIRKDSWKKGIRTSSTDVPLKDVTVKYATGGERNKIEAQEEIVPARKDSRKKSIRTSSIAATDAVQQAEQSNNEEYDDVVPIQRDFQKKKSGTSSIPKTAADAKQKVEQNKDEVYDDVVPIQSDFQKKRIRAGSIAKIDEQNKSETHEESKRIRRDTRRKSALRIAAKMNALDVSSRDVKLAFDKYQYQDKFKDRALYEDDSELNPFVTTIIRKLAAYQGGITPKKVASNVHGGEVSPKLGTLLGVFFPCVQNIFGVILFIRMVWIVGTAGWVETFIIFSICTSCVHNFF